MLSLVAALALAAPPGNADLVGARKTFEALQFEQTLAHLDRALAQPLRRADLIHAYRLRGLTFAILDRWNEASEQFRRVLVLDPKHELPDYVAPRFRRFFAKTRDKYEPAGWLVLEDVSPPSTSAGDPVFVTLQVRNDPLAMVAGVVVRYRAAGEANWRQERVPAGPTTRVRLGVPPAATGFDYIWTVLDGRGREIALIGTEQEPLRLELGTTRAPMVAAAADEPIWKRWWLWTIVGAVAVGAVTTTVVLATQPSTPDCPTDATCIGF